MNRKVFIRVCLLTAIVTVISMTTPAQSATVAYWRFEAGPAGTNVQHGAGGGVFSPDLVDSSGNGNYLAVWDSGQWQYRANVPYSIVPWTGAANVLSVKNVTGNPTMWNTSLATWGPAQWTIEATFKAEAGGFKTIVGRDSQGALTKGTELNAALSALYLQTTGTPDMGLAIKFVDQDGYWHAAESAPNAYVGFNYGSNPEGNNTPWYTIAATSDGRWLRLYLFNHDTPANGYVLIAQTDMTVTNPGSTNTALSLGAGDGGDWDRGNITVGRGMYNGGHGDRFYGYLDEVRLSDRALSPNEFLLAASYVEPVSPAADEYLMSTAAISYSWTTDTDLMTANEVVFDHYTIYVADNATDLSGDAPTTYLHKQNIANVGTQTYSGYAGTYAYGEDYYWRLDMMTMDPNDADPNNIVNNIPVLYAGSPVRFFGPRACPAVSISGNVSNMPDPITHAYVPQNAVFTAGITRGTVAVDAISWYKVVGVQDSLTTVDPNDTADTVVSNVAGVTEITFNPNLTTATSTTLTIVSAEPSDNGSYYARVRLVDPLGGGTGCSGNSPTASLFVRDDTHAGTDYLVHRYQFSGNANDSIGTAHGTVADLGDSNHAFADGQIQLINTGLSSRPITPVVFPAPTPTDPNATITRQQLLEQPGAYVDLPNGTISALGKSATFMVWFTYTSADTGNWPRLFDMGTSTGGEGFSTGGDGVQYIAGVPYLDTTSADLQEYIMMSPKRDAGPGWRVESLVRPASPESSVIDPADNSAFAGGVEACIAVSYNAAAGTMTVYVNGVQAGQSTNISTHDLAKINDVNNWLGRSMWPDAMFSGKINEFRIYDIPLSSYWVKAYSDQGPDDITTPNPCIQDAPNTMDFNADCAVNILDFAAFAQQWLNCDKLFGCN